MLIDHTTHIQLLLATFLAAIVVVRFLKKHLHQCACCNACGGTVTVNTGFARWRHARPKLCFTYRYDTEFSQDCCIRCWLHTREHHHWLKAVSRVPTAAAFTPD